MRLIYLDESGNTGTNLNDPEQPVFVLAALIVSDHKWQGLEQELHLALDEHMPDRPPEFEVHAQDLRNGARFFRGLPIPQRLALRDRWFRIAQDYDLRLIYRAIDKARFRRWSEETFGSGVRINPHVAAFPLVAVVVNDLLVQHPAHELGIFISDENLEVARDLEKSLQVLRGIEGVLRLDHIIEKGFFVDSRTSLVLQLCDLCAYALRKHAEHGSAMKPIDEGAYAMVQPLVHRGNERGWDVINWLTEERKKGATRD